MNTFDLSGKIVVLTGATGFLGRHHAEALAQAGASIILADLDQKQCDLLAKDITSKYGVKAYGIKMDITNPKSIKKAASSILKKLGRIDVLVNNAGIDQKFNPKEKNPGFEDFPMKIWQKILDVNLTGTMLTCQIIGGEMARRGKGSIINIASIWGLWAPDQRVYQTQKTKGFVKGPAYGASKAGMLYLTKYLAAYWGNKGIRTNALVLGGIRKNTDEEFVANYSKRIPLGRMGEPEDVTGAVVYLASDASSYVNGEAIAIDGGLAVW